MVTMDPIERLRRAIHSHNPQQVEDCFTPDYQCETPHRPSESFVGSDRVLANWSAIFARVRDLRAHVLRRASNGPELWSEWEMSGSDRDGNLIVLRGPVVAPTRDGRIDWARFYVSPVPARDVVIGTGRK